VFTEEFAIAAAATPPTSRPTPAADDPSYHSAPDGNGDWSRSGAYDGRGGGYWGGGAASSGDEGGGGTGRRLNADWSEAIGGSDDESNPNTPGQQQQKYAHNAAAAAAAGGVWGWWGRRAPRRDESLALSQAVNRGATAPPSLEDLSALFDLFLHYLKSLCVVVPGDAPVVQASHHGPQVIGGWGVGGWGGFWGWGGFEELGNVGCSAAFKQYKPCAIRIPTYTLNRPPITKK